LNRIREARATDIAGIADVVNHVWQQGILSDVCKTHIESDSSALWVATNDAHGRHPAAESRSENVIGFASAFLTADLSGHRRWEVDLVAVRPHSQGQGLGTQLIRHVCEVGEGYEVSLARALIRVENIASQRAFEHAGFTTDGQVHQLVLWSPEEGGNISREESELNRSASIHAGKVALLRTDTLTYRGLWIEGLTSLCTEEQRLAVQTARAIVARDRRDNTGTLIPVGEAPFLAADLREQGVVQGEYTWFVKLGSKTRNARH
jgi:L-amino acid N-acyltransferase YncA